MTTKLPPKRHTPLTAADAFTRICDLRDGREARRRYAATVFDAAESEAENAIAERVPEEQRARLRIMLAPMPEAEKMAAEIVAGRDVPAMTADEMRAALDGMPEPHFTVQPKTRAGDPLYVSADEIDDDAPLDNADATADDEPQAGSDTAEPLPKGAAPYEPGPAAKAAMGRHR